MDTGNVREWSVDDVANWLRQEKFASFAPNFLRYRIDGIALCDLQKDRFDTLTRSSMGRDDRASMLWKNINIIKRAKSRNANSNVNKNNRKPPPQTLGPPEPPQRDYRTDDYPQEQDESAEIEEDFEDTEDDNIDCFTDDEEIESDNGEYLDPTEDVPRGPPQVPSRPTDLNASWGQPARNPLTELEHDSDLYLAPAEEDDTYDVPENDAHDDEIYDIPDDPSNNVPAPSSRQPPISQQHNRHGVKQGPRIPPARTPQFPKPGGHHHTIGPPAPPIPSRVSPRPITPEEEQEYAFPDEECQDYIEPEAGSSGDENYLEPDLQPPSRNVQQHIQSRRLPTVPQPGAAPVHVPPRPDKHNNLTGSVDVPPVIPSRPQGGLRIPNLEGSSHNSKLLPVFPNGTESARPEPSRSPPRAKRIPTIPSSTIDNKNENSNASSDTTSRLVQNMKNRFEVDNNNTDSARRPAPRAKIGYKPTDRQYNPTPSSPTHTPSSVVQRPVTSGGNSVPRKPGIPPSTSSTASMSSMSSSSSSGSESGPSARQRKEPASWNSEMPPLPPATKRPSQPQLPMLNQSSVHQINERLAPSQPAKPAPISTRAPPSPSRVHVPPAQPQPVNELEGHPWYNGGIGRQESEKYLHQCRKDGAFIVRNSTRGDPANPYSLALWFNGRVRNLQIRKRKDQRYALGSRKDNELAFETPVQLIEHHMTNSLILAQDEGKTILKVGAPIY